MSTISALKAMCAFLVDEDDANLPLATVLVFFNECSDDLAPVARKRVRATADWAGGTEFALPSDVVTVRHLFYDEDEILPAGINTVRGATSYTRWGSVIVFSEELDAAEVECHYYRRLTAFTLGTDTPELPVQFHRLYALWAAARYWQYRDAGDEPAKVQAMRAEYEALKAELDRYTAREGGPRSFRVSFRW